MKARSYLRKLITIELIVSLPNIDDNMKRLLYILVQNTLFGEIGLSVKHLVEITNLSDSKVRSTLLKFSDMLYINKDGKKRYMI